MYLVHSDGFKWSIRPGTDDGLGPGHEQWLNEVMWIPSGGVFIDIGAHVGHFSVRLSKDASRVISFEPGIVQYRGLQKNLELNNITNVEAFFAAVSDKERVITMSLPPKAHNNGQMQIKDITETGENDTMAYPLDDYLKPGKFQIKPLDQIDLIKIDVQGHEGKVLAGMHAIVAKYKPRIVVELHDKEFHDPTIWEDVQSELAKMNYTWRKVNEYGTNWWIEAVPNA